MGPKSQVSRNCINLNILLTEPRVSRALGRLAIDRGRSKVANRETMPTMTDPDRMMSTHMLIDQSIPRLQPTRWPSPVPGSELTARKRQTHRILTSHSLPAPTSSSHRSTSYSRKITSRDAGRCFELTRAGRNRSPPRLSPIFDLDTWKLIRRAHSH